LLYIASCGWQATIFQIVKSLNRCIVESRKPVQRFND
jgi:hypothetical protein